MGVLWFFLGAVSGGCLTLSLMCCLIVSSECRR